jgi:hypothetical protein
VRVRCERCKTSELSLVTFGVYDCPVCGRVDADGNLVSGGEATTRGDSTDPNILDTGRASFVAPPPPSPLAASAQPVPDTAGSTGIPGLFLATIAVIVLLDVVEAIQTNSPISLLLQVGTMAALVTGKRWARTLAMAGAVLMIGLGGMLFVAMRGHAPYGALAAITIGTNAWWLYVLLRPDTVKYFSR